LSGAQGLSAKSAAVSRSTAYLPASEVGTRERLALPLGVQRWLLDVAPLVAGHVVHAGATTLLFAGRVAAFAPILGWRASFGYLFAVGRWWLQADATTPLPHHARASSNTRTLAKLAGGAIVMLGALAIPIVATIAILPMLLAARSTSQAQNHGNAGLALYQQGQLRDAIAEFDAAIEMNPRLAGAYVARAAAYGDLGDTQRALSDAATAVQLDPNSAGAYVNRARAYLGLANYSDALDDANTAIDLDPNLAVAYVQRANAHRGLGDYRGALDDANQAIERSPGFVPAHVSRGLAYSALGESGHAMDDWVTAISLTDDPDATAQIDALINNAGRPQ